MNREPLQHGHAWHQAGMQIDALIAECSQVAEAFNELAEDLLVAIGHTRSIQRKIINTMEAAA